MSGSLVDEPFAWPKNLTHCSECGLEFPDPVTWWEPIERQKAAMGVDWTISVRELSEAISPAYTEWIGQQLVANLVSEVAA